MCYKERPDWLDKLGLPVEFERVEMSKVGKKFQKEAKKVRHSTAFLNFHKNKASK